MSAATRIKLHIDTNNFVRFFIVALVFVAVLFLLSRLWPIILLVTISFFFAIALSTPVSQLAGRLPGHSRALATAISYVLVLVVLGTFLALTVPPVIRQTDAFISSLPRYIQELSSQNSAAARFIDHYHLTSQASQLVANIRAQSNDIAKGIGSDVLMGVSTFLNGLFTTLTVLVMTFMMLVEGPRWAERFWQVYQNEARRARHQELIARMHRVIVSYVNGQVLVALISGVGTVAMLLVLANFFTVPLTAIAPLGLLVFLTTLIPMFGATLGAILVTLVLLFNDIGAAVIYAIYFVVYQQIENNLIQPVVQSRTVELSALMVLIAVIAGVFLIGPVGALLAVPVAGCIRVLLIYYFERRARKQSAV